MGKVRKNQYIVPKNRGNVPKNRGNVPNYDIYKSYHMLSHVITCYQIKNVITYKKLSNKKCDHLQKITNKKCDHLQKLSHTKIQKKLKYKNLERSFL